VQEAAEEVEPLAEAKNHELTVSIAPDLPLIEIDVDMIRRVTINLLENAIKYTRSGGQVSIKAEVQSGEIVVSVQDNGPGISVQNQQRLFEKFSRIHHEGRPKGLGLGLAFCRLAVNAHGGKIWLESEEGQGSTFIFSLPLD
jgi:signal transduction histidine kinase